MAHRFEHSTGHDGENAGGFVIGLIAGAVVGAGLGMLFAPKSGAELRGQLSNQADEFASIASKKYRQAADKANDLMERGRDAYGSARETVVEGATYAQNAASSAVDEITSRTGSGPAEVRRS